MAVSSGVLNSLAEGLADVLNVGGLILGIYAALFALIIVVKVIDGNKRKKARNLKQRRREIYQLRRDISHRRRMDYYAAKTAFYRQRTNYYARRR